VDFFSMKRSQSFRKAADADHSHRNIC